MAIDLEEIERLTPLMVESGHRVLQIHRFADTDFAHVSRLERWAEFPWDARIADMGCGIGEVSLIMKHLRFDCDFVLINLSEIQLSYADTSFAQHVCSFIDVPEDDGSFDAMMFCFSIGHEDHAEAIKEARRLLRPGGILFIYDMVRIYGDNEAMKAVNYTVWPRDELERLASAQGFNLDFYMEPSDSGEYGSSVLGKDMKVFDGTIPAIWRFVKS